MKNEHPKVDEVYVTEDETYIAVMKDGVTSTRGFLKYLLYQISQFLCNLLTEIVFKVYSYYNNK